MAVSFNEKKIEMTFSVDNGTIKLTGSVFMSSNTSGISQISGNIHLMGEELNMDSVIGQFTKTSVTINNDKYLTYRTEASQLLDQVYNDSLTQTSTLLSVLSNIQ